MIVETKVFLYKDFLTFTIYLHRSPVSIPGEYVTTIFQNAPLYFYRSLPILSSSNLPLSNNFTLTMLNRRLIYTPSSFSLLTSCFSWLLTVWTNTSSWILGDSISCFFSSSSFSSLQRPLYTKTCFIHLSLYLVLEDSFQVYCLFLRLYLILFITVVISCKYN